ncbi:hypothetical protein D7030_02005 [Flavobacteriaceae bacterium AU392]|nr:hypothetical protein D1817_08480 [Flavobacteriaceae bacterium]RKM85470.1 hypothetical protein D7030_02005 [Flavobacteriaceae bacterium AU392]
MKIKNVVLLVLMIPMFVIGQDSKLSMFDNFIGKTWKADGNWGDGSKFKQEITFKYALDHRIIITNAKGFINKEQTELGLRNHGVRRYDKTSNNIKFWEFDVFGGLTEGIVFAEGRNIVYQYSYGDSFVTDMWEYVDDSTYNFKIGNYKNGVWKQVYLSTQFKAIE